MESNFNVISFSYFGMAIVFSGLIIISLYITVLPKLLKLLGLAKTNPATPARASKVGTPKELSKLDDETLTAIATAIQLELMYSENHKITWEEDSRQDSLWRSAGKSEGLSRRNLSLRRL